MVLTPPEAESQKWLERLSLALDRRAEDFAKFDDYYRGHQGTRLVNKPKYPPAFTRIFERYCENFMCVVVDAVEERLDIEGFRFPTGEADADATDPDAWRIWQDNQLDAMSQIGHTEALVKSVAYVMVSPFKNEFVGKDSPRITVELPDETIVVNEAGTRKRIVGMKRWIDDAAKRTYATLYYPDRIEKWEAVRTDERTALPAASGDPLPPEDPFHNGGGGTERRLTAGDLTAGTTTWTVRTVEGEVWPLPNPLGVVPIVPLINRPRLDGSGESEIKQVTNIQDAINTLAMNELVASEKSAIGQKWATGIEIPLDPETGEPKGAFAPGEDAMLSTSAPDAKFGQFQASDLNQFGGSIDQRVKRIASITRTPYHYFLDHGGQPPSGESLKSSETGLVRKARRKTRHFGEGWEEVMRLAFKVLEDPRADVSGAETVWANPESMTEAEHVDALTKKRVSLKVPLKQLWEDAGYSPVQIAKFEALLQAEAAMLRDTVVAPVDPAGTAIEQVQERVSA